MLYFVMIMLAFVFHIWMVVRVWSASGALWGLGVLFIPFVSILYILLNWRDDNGAKFPFFAGTVASIIATMVQPSISDFVDPEMAAAMMQDPEIQRQMEEDPQFRAEMEELLGAAATAGADGGDDADYASETDFDDDGEPDGAQPEREASGRPAFQVEPSYSAIEQQAWKLAMGNLPRRRGAVALAGHSAKVELPARMAFVERQPLALALASSKESLDPDVLGWVVHDDAPIDDRFNAWWIEVRAIDQGHVALGDAATGSVEQWKERAFGIASDEGKESGKLLSFLGFPVSPWVDDEAAQVAWVGSYGAGGEQAHLCTGMALGRKHQIAYSMRVKYDERWQELCLLSVRTLARKTEFDEGQGYGDYTRFIDDRSDVDAVDYFVGAKRIGKGF